MEENNNQKAAIQKAMKIISKKQLLTKITIISFIIAIVFTISGFLLMILLNSVTFVLGMVLLLLAIVAYVTLLITGIVNWFVTASIGEALDEIKNENLQEKINEFKNTLIRYQRHSILIYPIWGELYDQLLQESKLIEEEQNTDQKTE